MPEKEEDLVTLKIRSTDREWIKDEQTRVRKAERREPTHAELFARMRDVYERWLKGAISTDDASTITESKDKPDLSLVPQLSPPDPDLQNALINLATIRNSGDPDLWGWISGNLQVFAREARRQGGNVASGDNVSEQEEDFQAGVIELLRAANVDIPRDQADEGKTANTGTGGPDAGPVERPHAKPGGKRRKH